MSNGTSFISCGDIHYKVCILSTLFIQASLPNVTMNDDDDGDENNYENIGDVNDAAAITNENDTLVLHLLDS